MTHSGTVINGQIVLDGSPALPEGAAVCVDILNTGAKAYEYPHPMAPYDHEKEVSLLQERIAETHDLIDGREVLEELAKEGGFFNDNQE